MSGNYFVFCALVGNPGEVCVVSTPDMTVTNLGTTTEALAVAGTFGPTGKCFVLGKRSAAGYAVPNTDPIGLYVATTSALTRVGSVSPAQVDAAWSHFNYAQGIACDQKDGNPIIMVGTADAVANQQYFVKLNAATVAVMWTCAVNARDGSGDVNISRHRINNQKLYYLGAAKTLYTINTATGVATTAVIDALSVAGGQLSEDATNSLTLYGSWTQQTTVPTYSGTYMGTLGNHALLNQWGRWFAGATPSIMAYVGGSHVVGVNTDGVIPNWANNRLFFVKDGTLATSGFRQFSAFPSGDEAVSANLTDLGIPGISTSGAMAVSADGAYMVAPQSASNSPFISLLNAATLTLVTTFGDATHQSSLLPSGAGRLLLPHSIGSFTTTPPPPAVTPINPVISTCVAWTYTLDGHSFYVLDLAQEGTFLYDTTTGEWSNFVTSGYAIWDFVNGVQWNQRIVGADIASTDVWELVPSAMKDNGSQALDITHVCTGGLTLRSRIFRSCDAVRLALSWGEYQNTTSATISLSWSDDFGETFSTPMSLALTEGDFTTEITWTSLGSFAAPGRIFKVTDVGGPLRIDGCDAAIDGFDTTDGDPRAADQ